MVCSNEDDITLERLFDQDESSCRTACTNEPECEGFTISAAGGSYLFGQCNLLKAGCTEREKTEQDTREYFITTSCLASK